MHVAPRTLYPAPMIIGLSRNTLSAVPLLLRLWEGEMKGGLKRKGMLWSKKGVLKTLERRAIKQVQLTHVKNKHNLKLLG